MKWVNSSTLKINGRKGRSCCSSHPPSSSCHHIPLAISLLLFSFSLDLQWANFDLLAQVEQQIAAGDILLNYRVLLSSGEPGSHQRWRGINLPQWQNGETGLEAWGWDPQRAFNTGVTFPHPVRHQSWLGVRTGLEYFSCGRKCRSLLKPFRNQ